MIWSIAWRNIWRNKTRSVILITGIAIGLFAGVFSTGFYKGMADMRIKTAIKTEVSHIQLHAPYYLQEKEPHLYLQGTVDILRYLGQNPNIEGASRRLITESFFKSAHGSRGIKMIGIEPQYERMVTDISERITKGHYLDGDKQRTPAILVGNTLAEKLKLKINSKVPVDLVDVHGNFSSRLYRIVGLFSTTNTGYDESVVFVPHEELQKQLALPDDVAHEIAIYLKPDTDINAMQASLQSTYSNLDVKSWRFLNKELAMINDAMDQYMYIFVLIILLALAFSIINTMLMVVLERTKEIGMLLAVGMSKLRVFNMIILESIFVSLSGGILGIILGYFVIKLFEKRPLIIDLLKGFEQYGYSSEVYTNLPLNMALVIALMVFIVAVLSAIYPAVKAIRLDPIQAIRIE